MEPIKLYWRNQVPNCLKVLIILEELEIPYMSIWVPLFDPKECPGDRDNYARVPKIYDHSTGITLFESNAIINYLITTYDTSHILSYPSSFALTHKIMEWASFQASGQGSYSSQYDFSFLPHAEKPRSTDSYNDEGLLYVLRLLDSEFKDKRWLVEKKCTWADLAFLPWVLQIDFLLEKMKDEDGEELFARVSKWEARMLNRDGVQRALGKAALKDFYSD